MRTDEGDIRFLIFTFIGAALVAIGGIGWIIAARRFL